METKQSLEYKLNQLDTRNVTAPQVFEGAVTFNDPVIFNDSVTFNNDVVFATNSSLTLNSIQSFTISGLATSPGTIGVVYSDSGVLTISPGS
jgi:hypothetical protein